MYGIEPQLWLFSNLSLISSMAISSFSDSSFSLIFSQRKSHNNIITPTCKFLHLLSLRGSHLRLVHVNSYNFPPLVEEKEEEKEEAPPSLSVIQLGIGESLDSQPQPPPSTDHGEDLNDFVCGLFLDPQTQELGFEYYQKLKERGDFIPEKSTIRLLVRYLMRSNKWDLLLSAAKDIRTHNLFPDFSTCSRLIYTCVRARKFKIAEALLDEFKSDTLLGVVAFGSALRAYNKLHMYNKTIFIYQKMVSAGIALNSSCYCQIMEAFHKVGDADKVVGLFHEFCSRKRSLNPSTPVLTLVYKILCDSLGKSGRAFEALQFFRDMEKKENIENFSMYSSLICSFASSRQVKVAEELFFEAKSKKVLRDPAVYLKLVLVYIEQGMMEKSLETVKEMKLANVEVSDCIFCAVVNGFSKRRGLQAAIMVYEYLVLQGCKPGQVTYASIINVYCRSGLYLEAEKCFIEMQNRGFDKCVVAYSSMVVMYGKTGRLRDAVKIVAKMKERGCKPNVWIYNSLMDMHGRVQNMRQVEKLWKEMKRRKVKPDKVSYTTVISAYNKTRKFQKCVSYYNEFRINGGVIDKAMAGIMVGVFSKGSQIDELVKLLRDMKTEGTELDERLYWSAFYCLRDAGLEFQIKWLQESFANVQQK